MDSPFPFQPTLDRLRSLSQLDIRRGWRIAPEPALGKIEATRWEAWPVAELNAKGHIAWPQGRQQLWLYQTITWPQRLENYPIDKFQAKLALRWWADLAEIFVNGERVQVGDLFDCFGRILLTERLQPGKRVEVALRLLSPGHDAGALVRSQLCFERPAAVLPEPGFIADELEILAEYLHHFESDLLPEFTAILTKINWDVLPDRGQFDLSLDTVRRLLRPWRRSLKQRQIRCLGHAHLDMAWLWPVADTWLAAERTFESVLGLQPDFPELTYTHSTPALFAWLEQNRPQLFAQVQAQVEAGRWSVDAGLWVEPELMIIGGEAIARQILYGQRYCQEKFGAISAIAWLPDSFGFSWQLPQLLLQGGITCFATQKLRWNDTNRFPHELFRWRGRDGSEILALTLPPIGSDIEPVEMARYAYHWEQKTGQQTCLWLPGVGDHGGGPSRDMLAQSRRWARSPFFPTLEFGQVSEVLPPEPPTDLPIWEDELYLELHRGCYTTHGDQKWYNRRCETSLYEAELLSVMAERVAQRPYPQVALETAWKQALFNQFHDILPGSAIPEVFVDADRDWQSCLETCRDISIGAMGAIGSQIRLTPPVPGAKPWLVFNLLGWERRETVTIPASSTGQILDDDGQILPSQFVAAALEPWPTCYPPQLNCIPHQLAAVTVPALGYVVLWQAPTTTEIVATIPNRWTLENDYLTAEIDPATGDIASLWDKAGDRQVLAGPGNQLWAFADAGQYWDAWNIAPDYRDHPLPTAQLSRIEWIEFGPLRQRLRVVRWLAESEFQQDYVLDAAADYLKIESVIDWRANQVVVKANFPLAVQADHCTHEIPFGAINRPTSPQTPEQKAKWEVPMLRWADLSQGNAGVSLLSDAKHGLDFGPDRLGLTLLKAPLWPNPGADRGVHRVTYALYPHGGDWRRAQTVQRAINLGQPLRIYLGQPAAGPLSAYHSFWPEGASGMLAALKKAESGEGYVARFYEPHGEEIPFRPEEICGLRPQAALNLVEHPAGAVPEKLSPWQIVTIALADTQESA